MLPISVSVEHFENLFDFLVGLHPRMTTYYLKTYLDAIIGIIIFLASLLLTEIQFLLIVLHPIPEYSRVLLLMK